MASRMAAPIARDRWRAWSRQSGVWLCLAVVLLICVERRVAELDLDPDPDASIALENDETLDGVEILDRLIGLDTVRVPEPPTLGRAPVSSVVVTPVLYLPDLRLPTRVPRAPPSSPLPSLG